MALSVKIPGSCGELVQGVINDMPFLVTCPINRFVRAKIVIAPDKGIILPAKNKAWQALQAVCQEMGLNPKNIGIKLCSDLMEGKGMSSSSADIAAVCYAVAKAYDIKIAGEEIAAIAAAIEPTDGVFFPGIVKFNHINGHVLKYLGEPPPLQIAVFDCGGNVDTISFNKRCELPRLNREKERQVQKAFDLVEYGIAHNDIEAIGRGSTISALANQTILYKEQLPHIKAIAEFHDAVGINIAHSGTVIGVLFPADIEETIINDCVAQVQQDCRNIKFLYTVQLISGGCL